MSTHGNEPRLTAKQISDMKHALGGNLTLKGYRNYFNTRYENESWEELIQLRFATKNDMGDEFGGIYYYVTQEGIDWLKRIQ
jgi:alpha-amylase/alpha-mannosidase (GH57 family)